MKVNSKLVVLKRQGESLRARGGILSGRHTSLVSFVYLYCSRVDRADTVALVSNPEIERAPGNHLTALFLLSSLPPNLLLINNFDQMIQLLPSHIISESPSRWHQLMRRLYRLQPLCITHSIQKQHPSSKILKIPLPSCPGRGAA